MGLPLTGYSQEELVYLETKKLSVTIKGKASHPRIGVMATLGKISDLFVSCFDGFQLEVIGTKRTDVNLVRAQSRMYNGNYRITPLFYEQQNYEVVVESNSDCIIEFWHENLNIRNKIAPVGRTGRMLSGVINFANEIGLSDIYINVNGKQYMKIVVEVFPSKLQYKEDYLQLMSDVTDEVYNLAFEFLKKTYLESSINNRVGNSPTEFFSIIRLIYDKFIVAANIVLAHPHHVLQRTTEVLPPHKIKRTDQRTIKWLEKHSDRVQKSNGEYFVKQALAVKKQVSYDTIENRFAKFILHSVMIKLKNLRAHYARLRRNKDANIVKMIDTMMNGIYQRETFSFFKNIGEYQATTSMSLVFSMAPGYKDLYRYYLMLLRGLSLDGGIFKVSVKDLALLYEYWCFIKLNSIMKDKYNLIKQDIIKVDVNGLFVSLKKGAGSKVIYENSHTGERIELAYNPHPKNLPTVSQKPDNVLTLIKRGSKTKYEYIFDAKYKINPALEDSDYKRAYDTPGPEEEDINTMHRYRDALVHISSTRPDFERSMFGAYILFPYGDENEYQHHQFYQSIEKVNIGGLPFLPSATSLVSKMLDELIADSPDSAFERATLPVGIEEKLAMNDLHVRDVMVGVLRNKEQFDVNMKHNFYHIPVGRIPDYRFPIRYIALYQSDRLFGNDLSGIRYYGEVLRCSVVQRAEIKEIPSEKNPQALYYRFDIKRWKELDKPVRPREFGPRVNIFTNLFLLENSEYVPELYIGSKEELRLYTELKRLSAQVMIGDDSDKVTGFEFNGNTIMFSDKKITLFTTDRRHKSYDLLDFQRRTRGLFNEIRMMIGNFEEDK